MIPPYCVFLGRINIYAVYRLFHGLFTISKYLLGQEEGQVVITQAVWRLNSWREKGNLCVDKAVLLITLKLEINCKTPQTWLILGWAFVFFFEVVSRPQREENLLLRLLQERDMACVRRLTPVSVRAATCKNITTQSGLVDLKSQHISQ